MERRTSYEIPLGDMVVRVEVLNTRGVTLRELVRRLRSACSVLGSMADEDEDAARANGYATPPVEQEPGSLIEPEQAVQLTFDAAAIANAQPPEARRYLEMQQRSQLYGQSQSHRASTQGEALRFADLKQRHQELFGQQLEQDFVRDALSPPLQQKLDALLSQELQRAPEAESTMRKIPACMHCAVESWPKAREVAASFPAALVGWYPASNLDGIVKPCAQCKLKHGLS